MFRVNSRSFFAAAQGSAVAPGVEFTHQPITPESAALAVIPQAPGSPGRRISRAIVPCTVVFVLV